MSTSTQKLTKKELRKKFTKAERRQFALSRQGKGSVAKGKPSGVPLPKKTWKNQRKDGISAAEAKAQSVEEKGGKNVAKMAGQRGQYPIGDERMVKDRATLEVTMISAIDRKVQINERAIYNTAAGIVFAAMKRGACYPDTNLYQAYLFLANTFVQAFAGAKLDGLEFPPRIWDLLAAMGPKKVGFKTGWVDFSSEIVPSENDTYKTTSQVVYNNTLGDQAVWNFGSINTGVQYEGFPAINNDTSPYDEKEGSKAAARLWTFFGINKLVTLQSYKPSTGQDASCYSAVVPEYGRAWDSVGAIRTSLSNSVKIDSPILGKYCQEIPEAQNSLADRRGFHQYRASSLGSLYVGTRSLEFAHPMQFRNKCVAMCKTYDFFDFFESISIWLCRLLEQHSEHPTEQIAPLTMTAQDVAILLRYIAMKYFDNHLAADIDDFDSQSEELNYVPLSPGMSTTFRDDSLAYLPSFMSENLRCIRRHIVKIKGGLMDEIPVLVLLAGSGFFNGYQYTWTDKSGVEHNLYPDPAPEAIPINLIDCSVIDTSTFYLNLDGDTMGNLIKTWNSYVKQLANYSTQLQSSSSEAGTYCFMPTYMTVHYQTVINPEAIAKGVSVAVSSPAKGNSSVKEATAKLLSRRSSVGLIRKGTKRIVVGVPKPGNNNTAFFSNTAVTDITAGFSPFAATWKYQQAQWMPFRWKNHGGTGTTKDVNWWMETMAEPFRKNMSTQPTDVLDQTTKVTSMTRFDRNSNRAEFDIKTDLSEKTEWQKDCEILAEHGSGGIIETIANLLGNAFNAPWIGTIGKVVDGLVFG